jgi:hypothetical protein
MAPNEVGATFDEFVEGGFGFDDVDVTVKAARFAQWDYRGKIPAPVLALKLDMVDAEGKEGEEFLSSGELRFFVPSSDGKKAIPVGNQAKLNINTNAVAFILSLMNADTQGLLAAKLRGGDDISVIDGVQVHVVRKAQPKRPGIATPEVAAAQGGNSRVQTQMLVEKLIAYPPSMGGGTVAGAAKGATASAPAAAGGAAPTGEIADMALGLLVQLISEAGAPLKVSAIAGKVFTNPDMKAQPAPVRNAVLGLIVKPEFLGAEGQPWTFDKQAGTVSLG